MKKQIDILILTASFGLGHNSVAKAINEQTLAINPNLKITTIDLLDIAFPASKYKFYKKYNFFIEHIVPVYNFFYFLKKYNSNSLPDEFIYLSKLKQLSSFLLELNPRLIVSTFPICSGLVSRFKQKYKSNTPLITCITDVVDSKEWIHPNTDRYFAATNIIKSNLINKGIPESKVKVTGIPVRKQFLRNKSQNINIDSKNCKELLIMGGGLGNLKLDKDFLYWLNSVNNLKTTIITGKNKDLYKELKSEKSMKNIEVLGFTENIANYMGHSDMLITKAGGISIFEAIHMDLPMIVISPSMGQEIENAKFVKTSEIGIIKKDTSEIKNCLSDYLYSDNTLKNMKENICTVKNELESTMVGNYILELM